MARLCVNLLFLSQHLQHGLESRSPSTVTVAAPPQAFTHDMT